MPLKQVPSYQTSDGTLHASKLTALIHEQKIEVRGIIQSGLGGVPLRNGHVTTAEAVQIILENSDKLAKINSIYKQAINRERVKFTQPVR